MHAAIGYQQATAAADARIAAALEKALNAEEHYANEADDRATTTMTTGASGVLVPGRLRVGRLARAWPGRRSDSVRRARYRRLGTPVTRAGAQRAGDGNRTRIVSLGS
jgi:hypothetical protein